MLAEYASYSAVAETHIFLLLLGFFLLLIDVMFAAVTVVNCISAVLRNAADYHE